MIKKDKNSIFNLPAKNMRFDIPLHARVGTEFLAFLMALMTFLCILAGCVSISLNNMAASWTTGLADTVTIEVPASDKGEAVDDLVAALQKIENVKAVKLMDDSDLQQLVEPWLGKDTNAIAGLPVPSLISLEMTERNPEVLTKIRETTEAEIPDARIDAHENWLQDIVKLSKGLQFAGAALIFIILVVTALTVSGAVRSRMAIHHMELELLHLMGASDKYITQQFQKYILFLSGRGVGLGLVLAIITIICAHFLAIKLPETLPRFNFTLEHLYVWAGISLLLVFISTFAAKRTVMTVLKEMP